MPLDKIRFGTLRPDRRFSNRNNRPVFDWLEEEIGFYPFSFLWVAAIAMTSYYDNWRAWAGREFPDGTYEIVHRKGGEFPNLVLFSFDALKGVSWIMSAGISPSVPVWSGGL